MKKYQTFSQEQIDELDRIKRINLINSVTGVKPANLIGTTDGSGHTNLAIFSSVIHLGSNPPLLGCISRPVNENTGHTIQNIMEIGYYTINAVDRFTYKQAHLTSGKYSENQSEFDIIKLTPQYHADFSAPFVGESNLQIGLKLVSIKDIEINNTKLIIGQVQIIRCAEAGLTEELNIDLEKLHLTGIGGNSSYYSLNKLDTLAYIGNEVK